MMTPGNGRVDADVNGASVYGVYRPGPALGLRGLLGYSDFSADGSRHEKRWQDVEELRDAGIEVWTTMNVQHLESSAEAVARVTGVRVAEGVGVGETGVGGTGAASSICSIIGSSGG